MLPFVLCRRVDDDESHRNLCIDERQTYFAAQSSIPRYYEGENKFLWRVSRMSRNFPLAYEIIGPDRVRRPPRRGLAPFARLSLCEYGGLDT